MLLYIFWIFIGFLAIQLFYFFFIYGRFAFSKPEHKNSKLHPVSVIVCAKNELENCKKLIPLLLEQDYPAFELVLVDDASSDETLELFESFESLHKNIKLVKVENIEAFWGNRKFALTLGIKAAKYEHLLFIEPQSVPSSKQWIKEMSQCFDGEKTIILGYNKIEKKKNSFLNLLMRYEHVWESMHTFGFSKIGKPFRGSGHNLAYHRKEFFHVRGFNDHMKIYSGEDELFINQASTAKNTTYTVANNSFTITKPKLKYSEWFNQKRRQLELTNHFKKSDQFQLKLYDFSLKAFLFIAFILLLLKFQWEVVLGLLIARYLVAWITMGVASRKLDEKDVIFFFPFLELFWIFTKMNMLFSNVFSKPNQWK
jgi:glycosyltransferase involved in cell wall biosynthesis